MADLQRAQRRGSPLGLEVTNASAAPSLCPSLNGSSSASRTSQVSHHPQGLRKCHDPFLLQMGKPRHRAAVQLLQVRSTIWSRTQEACTLSGVRSFWDLPSSPFTPGTPVRAELVLWNKVCSWEAYPSVTEGSQGEASAGRHSAP